MMSGHDDVPPAKRAKKAIDQLRAEFNGPSPAEDFPAEAVALKQRCAEQFTFESLEQAEDSFRAECLTLEDVRNAKPNALLRRIVCFLRHELDLACVRFTRLESWLKFRTPRIEDGNNFGVDVQKQFLSTVQDYRNYCWKELCALKNIAWNRAVVSESMEQVITEETSELVERGPPSAETARDGDISATRSTKTLKQNRHKVPHVQHYLTYVVDLDVESYFKLRHTARNLCNYFADIYDMFEKNREKITFPRGKEDGGSNLLY